MHIAIDDTYGPISTPSTRYITGQRKSAVAVVFPDSDVADIQQSLSNLLGYVNSNFNTSAEEFHFTDLYNRVGPWKRIENKYSLAIFRTFVEIYSKHRWPVHIQTIDDRTLSDHGINEIKIKIEAFNLGKRDHLALVFLLIKLKNIYSDRREPLTIYIDEGIKKAEKPIDPSLFEDWPAEFSGSFKSSRTEPLLQIADFIAYSINRMTYLSIKPNRTAFDTEILDMLGHLNINSPDIRVHRLPSNFTQLDVDKLHDLDRISKDLPLL